MQYIRLMDVSSIRDYICIEQRISLTGLVIHINRDEIHIKHV